MASVHIITPEVAALSLGQRVWSKLRINNETGCWEWIAAKSTNGYGKVQNIEAHRVEFAHRFVYEQLVGPIPDGLQIDHLCRVHHCVNPRHLEPVTLRENLLRGVGFVAVQSKRTHCPKGHAYEGDNLYVANGKRDCRTCRRERSGESERRRRPENQAAPNRDKTHCPSGHPYSTENTYVNSRGWRRCKTCIRGRESSRSRETK